MDTHMNPHGKQSILPDTNYLGMSRIINFTQLQNVTNNFHFVHKLKDGHNPWIQPCESIFSLQIHMNLAMI